MPAGPSISRRRVRGRIPGVRLIGAATVLVVTAACGSAAVTPVGSTSTVSMSAASTSIAQTALPESATSAADSEPVDIPITAGGDPALVNAPAAGPAATLVIDDGTFDQASVTIPVGGVVAFLVADDAEHAVVVGTLSAVTVTGEHSEYYQFPVDGTFEVTDQLSAATATIFVG